MASVIQSISPLSINGVKGIENKQNENNDGSDFFSILQKSLEGVNGTQIEADKALKDISTGQVKDLHQAAISLNKAEIDMKMMLEVRNKALNAYKDILKTQM